MTHATTAAAVKRLPRSRMHLAGLLAITLVLHACTSAPQPVAATVTPTSESPMPTAPWSIIFADASGNSFHFLQPAEQATAEFEDTPITWEESSSGAYSGGMAARGELTPSQVQQIWTQVTALRANTASHVDQRTMGTGSFVVLEHGVRREFIVGGGPAVEAFTALVAPLRAP